MNTSTYLAPNDNTDPAATTPREYHSANLHFPFRANTIARKARSPGQTELNYQFAEGLRLQQEQRDQVNGIMGSVPLPKTADVASRRSSGQSDSSLPIGTRKAVDQQIHKEEDIGGVEEVEEIERAAEQDAGVSGIQLAPVVGDELPSEDNARAALREAPGDLPTGHVTKGPAVNKKGLRRDQLAKRLQEVFGLQEREEVLEEMRCWLLRSVSKSQNRSDHLRKEITLFTVLKGYMYLTPKRICFFAQMPDRDVRLYVRIICSSLFRIWSSRLAYYTRRLLEPR